MEAAEATNPERFGPFLLLRELGAGGMGSAFLARHADRPGFLVVKRLHQTLLSDPTVFKRFVHEAEVASHVLHDNVAALVAMGSVGDEPFLATEHVYGLALSQIVHRVEESQIDPIPLPVALHMAVELASAVEAIHEARHRETGAPLGLLHRDIGARNVLVGFDGRLRLIDLGLGKSILSDWQTNHQVVAGSPDYMAPEQAMGGEVDTRADVYATAVTIWELIAGRKRIQEDSIAARLQAAVSAQPEPLIEHRSEASPRLEAILKNAMAYDPSTRTASITILKKTLQEEAAALKQKTTQDDVKEWLDGSCATLIAKERRKLEAVEKLGTNLAPPRANTQMYVGQIVAKDEDLVDPYNYYLGGERPKGTGIEGTFARIAHNQTASRIAKLVDPERLARSGPAAKILLFGGIFALLIMVAATSAWLFSPRDPAVTAQPLPPPPLTTKAPPPPAVPPVAPPPLVDGPPPEVVQVAPPPDVTLPPPQKRSPPPPVPDVSKVDPEAKRLLLARIKRLRRASFDVDFQRSLTRLSARLSRVRSKRAYREVERQVKRLERDH